MEIQKGQLAIFVVINGRAYPPAMAGRTIVQGKAIGIYTLGQIIWPGEGRMIASNLARDGYDVMAAAEVSLDGSQCKQIVAKSRRQVVECLRQGGAAMLSPRHEGARFMRVAMVGDLYVELMAPRQPNIFVPRDDHRWLLRSVN